ncbi:MarR family transcriptional regulator [Micromonospora tulbaghiae]|uniref:MarR family transcriptional regulator n=1 Tax=Micromonospora tulbaghiae TaxID=479978 RepID=A0AAW4JFP5_9ACTN|nr:MULTISPECIES: MarR family transcriptional regulator [Micromonospora]KAB1908606.1 MarR family transcriptional regulator [Micromonospora sp. AMSO1212t]MBO4140658.1 MarR family transcriptional regulator [Micromonospora tulbaghiae]MDX5457203.1 MarR family transcriptional regulator [Micromonospora tulbaghiae]
MTESLDAERMACWRAYIESSQRLFTRLEDDLRADSDLSFADYHVLVLLSEAPGQRLRMGELADRLVFSPSRLTYQVATMRKRGLVAKEACPADRRGSEAVLTAAGLLALREAAPHHLRSVRAHLIDDLDDAEVACLTRVFERLGRRLRADRTASSTPADK